MLKTAGLLFFALAVFLASLLMQSDKTKSVDTDLFAEPLLYRAFSGYTHTFEADKLWLASNAISEMNHQNSYAVNSEAFRHAFELIAIMDPHFFQAANYGATYLASIKNDLNGSVTIIDNALAFTPESFNLLFLKMILLVTYGKGNMHFDTVKQLAKKLITLDTQKVFGRLSIEDLIEEMYVFAASKNAKRQKEIEDLLWLYKTTKDQNTKKTIAAKLKSYGVSF